SRTRYSTSASWTIGTYRNPHRRPGRPRCRPRRGRGPGARDYGAEPRLDTRLENDEDPSARPRAKRAREGRVTMGDAREIEAVLDFWFGELDDLGCADAAHTARWFASDEAFDAECRARFSGLHQAVASGEREAWLASPRGRLAYVIVLD